MTVMVTHFFTQASQAPPDGPAGPADHCELDLGGDATMISNSSLVAAAVAEAYDFSQFSTMVDVGGGQGRLLSAILAAHPTVNGVLFDQPHVVAGAGRIAEQAGVADRCEIIGGDFFQYLPSGAIAYVLERIIHDWDDEHAVIILTNCRRAMGQRGTLLLVERLLPDGDACARCKPTGTGARIAAGRQERSVAEYRALLWTAGFTLGRVIPTSTSYSIVEGVPFKGTH
jgi:hypothetical protein